MIWIGAVGEVFVANSGSNNLSVINDTLGNVTATVAVGYTPSALLFADGELFVANEGSNNVSVVNPRTLQVVESVPVGAEPDSLSYNVVNEVLVANRGSANVTLLANDSVNLSAGQSPTWKPVASIPAGPGPAAILDPYTDQFAYVADSAGTNVTPINAEQFAVNATTIPVGADPVALASGDGGPQSDFQLKLFVANGGSANLSVVDIDFGPTQNQVLGSVPVGLDPDGLYWDPGTGRVYVSNAGSDNVSVVDGVHDRPLPGGFPVGQSPAGVTLDSAKECLFVANRGSNNVTVACGLIPTLGHRSIPVTYPSELAYDAHTGVLYAGTPAAVVPINTSDDKIAGKAVSSSAPGALVYDARDGAIFGATFNSSSYGLIEINDTNNQVVRYLELAGEGTAMGYVPCGLVFDPDNDFVYAEAMSLVYIVNASSGAVVGSVAAPGGFCGLGFNTGNDQVYFESASGNCSLWLNRLNGSSTTPNGSESFAGPAICLQPYTDKGVGFSYSPISYDPRTGLVYVVNYWTESAVGMNLSVVNGTTATTLPSPIHLPFGDYDSVIVDSLREMFIASYWNVTVLNLTTGSVVGSLGCGEGCSALAYAGRVSTLYVTNSLSSDGPGTGQNVTAIPVGNTSPPTANSTVTFASRGGSPGARWSVTIGPLELATSNSTVRTVLRAGESPYEVTAPRGYHATRGTGILLLSGNSVTVQLSFLPNSSASSPNPSPSHDSFAWWPAVAVGLAIVLATLVGLIVRRRSPPGPGHG